MDLTRESLRARLQMLSERSSYPPEKEAIPLFIGDIADAHAESLESARVRFASALGVSGQPSLEELVQAAAELFVAKAQAEARAGQLERERDEARRFGEHAAKQYNELLAESRLLWCAFCGEPFPADVPQSEHPALVAHMRACEKHPLRKAEAEVTRLTQLLEDVSEPDRSGDRIVEHLRYQIPQDLLDAADVLAFQWESAPESLKRAATQSARESLERVLSALDVVKREPSLAETALATAKAEGRAEIFDLIRKLPSPWNCVTAGANPQKDGTMSPPMWHGTCGWCGAKATVTKWKYPDHPLSDTCLWALAQSLAPAGETV